MAQQVINVGAVPNDGTGDPIRTAYIKCNNNFDQLFDRFQSSVPTTVLGAAGDVAGMYAADSGFLYVCFQDYDGSSEIWGRVVLDTSW